MEVGKSRTGGDVGWRGSRIRACRGSVGLVVLLQVLGLVVSPGAYVISKCDHLKYIVHPDSYANAKRFHRMSSGQFICYCLVIIPDQLGDQHDGELGQLDCFDCIETLLGIVKHR